MRKKLGSAAVLATSAVVLAACSSGGGGEASPSPTDTTPALTGSLTLWTDDIKAPSMQAVADQFEAETGVSVEVIIKNFEDIRSDALAQIPTGEGPDIFTGAHDWLGALVEGGVVDTVELGANAANFSQVGIDALSYDGQLYGMPYSLEAIALIQNVDLVGEDAPATWDEMIQAGIDSGAERPFCMTTNGETGDGYFMYPFQTSFGAPVFVQEGGSYTSEVGMGGDAGLAFASWMSENGESGEGHLSTTVDYDIAVQLFNDGKCAYTVNGPWSIPGYEGVNLKVNPVPSAGGEDASPFVGVAGFYVSSQSQNALLANDFLTNYVATADTMQALFDADPRLPAFDAVDISGTANPEATQGFIDSAAQGVPMLNIPEMGQVWEYWNAAEAAIIKGADADATWSKMITDLTAALEG